MRRQSTLDAIVGATRLARYSNTSVVSPWIAEQACRLLSRNHSAAQLRDGPRRLFGPEHRAARHQNVRARHRVAAHVVNFKAKLEGAFNILWFQALTSRRFQQHGVHRFNLHRPTVAAASTVVKLIPPSIWISSSGHLCLNSETLGRTLCMRL
jgi:hypothetical protein